MKISEVFTKFNKIIYVLIILSFIFAAYACSSFSKHHISTLKLSAIPRGDLLVSVNATGTIEPEEVIDVGAQVAGQILSFGTGKDGKPIDYGSSVEEGMILARIDESLYASDVAQSEAQLQKSKADLIQLQARLLQQKKIGKESQS